MNRPATCFVRRSLPLLGLILACNSHTLEAPQPVPRTEARQLVELNPRRKLDLLFLVDKSPTMRDLQASLVRNFPRFMRVLEQIEGGLPDLHLGVITQDVGAGGYTYGFCAGIGDGARLQNTPRRPGCTPPDGFFIRDEIAPDGARVRNYTGTLADAFSCIAEVGPDGCGFEQHLFSLAKALDGTIPENAGFLRPDAYLGIVILSDEDDCSAHDPVTVFNPRAGTNDDTLGPPVDFRCAEFGWTCDGMTLARAPGIYQECVPRRDSPYLHHPDIFVDFIRGLKEDPERILIANIIGPPGPVEVIRFPGGWVNLAPVCTNSTSGATAFPMPRLKYFAEQVSSRHTFVSICEDDLSPGLQRIAEQIRRLLNADCLSFVPRDRDGDPGNGLQPDCVIAESMLDERGARGPEYILPPCGPSETAACWRLDPAPDRCPQSGYAIAIDRQGLPTPAGAVLSTRCQAEVH